MRRTVRPCATDGLTWWLKGRGWCPGRGRAVATPRAARWVWAALLCCGAMAAWAARATAEETIRGQVRYEPAPNEEMVAERFRLEPHTFAYEQEPIATSARSFSIYRVTFPSPVKTPHERNNTVHCEYFRPRAEQPVPGVVVLHILGGDFDLSRLVCRTLASHGIAALFLKMPYYGPRAEPGVDVAMIDPDPEQTVRGMTQAVLDIRRGAAWLAAQDEVDEQRLGVMGISLGGITAALAMTAEPRFGKGFLMLAGGDVARIAWESPLVRELREKWEAEGGTRESLIETIRPVDPVTYGQNIGNRRVMMYNALNDEVVPRACTDALWQAFGKPEIVWVDAGHYSVARFIFDALARATRFFQADDWPSMPQRKEAS